MSKYKPVPEELLKDWCERINTIAAETAFNVADEMGAMLSAAPPAVQVEPVAYAVFADNGNIRIWSADPIQTETLRLEYGDQVRPLYTEPKPAEQQSAPDVAGLVDALRAMVDQAQRVSVCGNLSSDVVLRAIYALATYRKQGGEL